MTTTATSADPQLDALLDDVRARKRRKGWTEQDIDTYLSRFAFVEATTEGGDAR